ncbi:MAG: TIGR02281 family clan AA aspartic protease [Gammaproteobacteria bacterium]|nr:MAG: TIGR02281 family clan AA aspartic protease [Gammaproteobacteria bacterium]RLA23892.1 MAG: TIGR02281 family clan AA aspartic protease [Gammaproteobacteria bacterium]
MIYGAWIIALLMLTWLFDNYLGKQHNPNQMVSSEIDGNGIREVTLKQNRQGHYIASGFINEQKVTFLVDTGATTVSIPGNLANKLNLPFGLAQRVRTANGDTIAYSTTLNSIRLGNIKLYKLKATIAPKMAGDGVLLGMNFMRQLEMIQRDNQLTLRQH